MGYALNYVKKEFEMNIKLEIPDDFYREEERCDYVINDKMKKVWAVQLDLLDQLKKICAKHNLTYYADSGTLIGAVRHRGFIPWDDDIDIVMMRKDYEKLISLASSELDAPYFLQSAHSEIFPRGYARLRNSDTTALTAYDLGKDLNHGIFIDIFPLDKMPDDLKIRRRWLQFIRIHYTLLLVGCGHGTSNSQRNFTALCKVFVSKLALKVIGYHRFVARYEKLCAKYNDEDTNSLSYVAYSLGKEKHIWSVNSFKSGHSVPFEFTEICIPDGYDSRLRIEYGDYMKIVHSSTTHGTLILEPEIPYKIYMERHSEKEIADLLNDSSK